MSVVVVCDGLRLVRDAIVRAVEQIPGVDRVEQAASTDELITRVRGCQANAVVIDGDLPGGIAVALQFMMEESGPVVVVLVNKTDAATAAAVLGNGGSAYLVKDISEERLAAAVGQAMLMGRPRTDPRLRPGALRAARTPIRLATSLTPRELQVLTGMSEGKSNGRIGRDLYLSEDTIKTHARRMFRKLQVQDRAGAVSVGFRTGLLT